MFKDGKSPGVIAGVLNEGGVLSPMEDKLSRGDQMLDAVQKE